jgi:hypothetical protein
LLASGGLRPARCGQPVGIGGPQFQSSPVRPDAAETWPGASIVRYNGNVHVEISPDLADRLAASVEERRDIHHVLCTNYTVGEDFGCTCGMPGLLVELARLLGVDVAAMELAEAAD